ncbi:PXA domain-containing protein [Choanephora cucurbitarum]|nr:PXA domain-containing protein [Choanephora cucurbitarum]
MSPTDQAVSTLLSLRNVFLLSDTEASSDLVRISTGVFLAVYTTLLITSGYFFLIFIALGFALGALYFNNKDGSFRIEPYERHLSYKEQTLEQYSNSINPPKEVQLYYQPLTAVVNQLLDYVMRDFVSSWWSKLNEYNDTTFERLARERLNTVALNVQKILLNQERNDIVMSTVYGLANTLIIHMRECRAFEESELPMTDFVVSNPQSPFSQLLSREEQHKQLRGLSQLFIKRTLPAADRESLILSTLVKELLTNFVFESVVSSISDPDFLNRQIVEVLSNKNAQNVVSSSASAIVLGTTSSNNSDEDLPSYNISPKSASHEMNTASKDTKHNIQPYQVTPPSSPERHPKPTPINTSQHPSSSFSPSSSKPETTMLASLQSPPPPPSSSSPNDPPQMIFPPNSVNFTVMDISPPQTNEQSINKNELVYIIQIERPAMEDQSGAEGGGYVITRTYADFESLHVILFAKHPKRMSKLQLKLPLETVTKFWMKKSTTQQKNKSVLETAGSSLQRYLDTVVQDEELGTDPLILPFLRKETRSEIAASGSVMSFSEEFQNEVASSLALIEASTATQPSRSRSLFSRSNNSANTQNTSSSSLNVPSSFLQAPKTEANRPDDKQNTEELSGRWFTSRTAKSRQGSFSSLHSNISRDSAIVTKDEQEHAEEEEPHKKLSGSTHSLDLQEMDQIKVKQSETSPSITLHNKALSPMDVELLIETTYALVVEIFNLTTSNNKAWMRRSILNLLREIVRRSYTTFISEQYNDFVNQYMSPDAIVNRLNQLGEKFWPEGKWILHEKEQAKRTDEDKEKTKQLARTLMMNEMIPSTVRQLIGDQNCMTAMDRMWARIQDPDLNRVLILQVLERVTKPILG